MRFVRPSDSSTLEQMVADLTSAAPTYSAVGGTLPGRDLTGFTTTTMRRCSVRGLTRFSRRCRSQVLEGAPPPRHERVSPEPEILRCDRCHHPRDAPCGSRNTLPDRERH